MGSISFPGRHDSFRHGGLQCLLELTKPVFVSLWMRNMDTRSMESISGDVHPQTVMVRVVFDSRQPIAFERLDIRFDISWLECMPALLGVTLDAFDHVVESHSWDTQREECGKIYKNSISIPHGGFLDWRFFGSCRRSTGHSNSLLVICIRIRILLNFTLRELLQV